MLLHQASKKRCWAGDNSDEDVGGGPAKRCGEDGAKGGGEDLTGALERQRGGGSGDEFNREDDDPGCQWEDDDEWPAIEEYFSQHPNASGAGGGGAAGDQRGDSDESDEESPFPDDDVDELMREVAGDGAMNEDADAGASEGALELRPRPLHDAGGDQELTPTHAHVHEGASCVSDEVVALLYGAGLEDHVGAFVREEICMLSLPLLSEADFLELGVTDKGARAILRGLVRERDRAMPTLPRAADASSGAGAVGGHWGRRAGGTVCARESATAPSPDAAASRRTRITDFFANPRAPRTKRARAEHITAYFATESGRTLPPPPARDTPAATGATAVRVPGTSILVDGFRYRSVPCSNYILTHFHADHYVGLTKHMAWCSKESVVWCTPITAALVHARIGTPRERLRVLAVGKSADIEGHRVTFVDANHCPGAVMVHVQLKGGGCVLHTGDCRWDGARMPAILSALPPAQTLVLDTTYCNPQYTFPPQAEVIDFVEKAVKAEAFNGGQTLFLIGSYSIGKERLYLELARRLNTKVYVSPTKLATLKLLGLTPPYLRLLTTDDKQARIHIVPLWKLTAKNMRAIAKYYKMRFKVVVGFAPTGWSQGGPSKTTRGIGSKSSWSKGTLVKYSVPYSEHSSFDELRQLVRFVNPARIVPHVFGGASADDMVDMLRGS
eukprot:PRCOL_00005440-RA